MQRRFLPLLSYSRSEVDCGMDPDRDEGEARLRKVRALLRSTTKTVGMETFLDPGHRASLGALVAPRKGDPSLGTRVMDSLLVASHATKPAIAMMTPTVRTMGLQEADELDAVTRQACVPIKREDLVALPGALPIRATYPIALITWPKSFFGGAAKGPATGRATLRIEYMGPGRVRFTVVSATNDVVENLYAADIPGPILSTFFDVAQEAAPLPVFLSSGLRIPHSEGDLPEHLQLQLAGFAQLRLRAHVLSTVAGPMSSNRPLAFENMKLSWRTVATGAKKPIMQIKAYFHSSSVTCFCDAHVLESAEKRYPKAKFTGHRYACMNVEMCGECLSPENDMGCPTHGATCKRNREFAPGVCCSNLAVSFSCSHECHGEWKPYGLWLPCDVADPYDWRELSMLVALAAQYDRSARPMLGKGAPADAKQQLERMVNDVTTTLEERVARFDMHALGANRPSDADLLKMDMLAAKLLREGGTVQGKLTKAQKAPKLLRHSSELGTEEKKLARTHHWLFPRNGQPFGKRASGEAGSSSSAPSDQPGSPSEGGSDAAEPAAAPVDEAWYQQQQPPQQPGAKRQRTEARGYDYEGMTEFMDPAGLASIREQLAVLLAQPNVPERQRDRGQHFTQFLKVCDNEYGEEVDGPLGLPARPLFCKYRSRNDGGRLYPTGMPKAPGWHAGEARSVCIQAAPREVRPFLCCRWAHDFDMANAQPEMLRQMAGQLKWSDGRASPNMPEMEKWCADRPEYIQHVADLHRLPTDAQRHYEYRKDTVKELMIRLMFGGKYESWIKDICTEFGRPRAAEPRAARVVALQQELLELRAAVFASIAWAGFCAQDRARLVKEGKKKDADAVDRAVFARIAQKTENDVLTVMRAFLKERGWTVLTLCFDGVCSTLKLRDLSFFCLNLTLCAIDSRAQLVVMHRPERELELAAMNARIEKDTGYQIEIVEKPLYSPTFPVLSLNRA